jgi:glutathione S-transferase
MSAPPPEPGPPALRLHGYGVSNYFNIAYAALLEKALPFELVEARASQDAAFLQISPMGKIPVLQTPYGWLAETVAILDYLEDAHPEPALRPADAFARAKGRQLINVVQMYIEAPTRSLFPGVFFGGQNSETVIAEARAMLDRGQAALRRLAAPAPFLLGSSLTTADLFAFYCLDIADRVSGFVHQRSLTQEIGLTDWTALMGARASSRTVLGAFETLLPAYLAQKNAAYRPAAQRTPHA